MGKLLIMGIALALYGAVSDPAIYQRSLGINVNLIWGSVLLVFGIIMLLLARRGLGAPRAHETVDHNVPIAR